MKISIIVFSGTGNTAILAGLLKDDLLSHNTVDVFAMEDIMLKKVQLDAAKYDLIGLGYPSYGFNTPPIVDDFAKTLDGNAHNGVFLFMTCAGPCYINDIAAYSLKKILQKRGFRIVYERVFCMPANVLIRFRDEIVKQLYIAVLNKIRIMAADLTEGKEKVRNDGILAMLIRCIYVWYERLMMVAVAKDFIVKKTCTKCLKCVNACPRCNISLKGNRIKFGWRCTGCYRCVYNCPQRAIAGRLFNVMIFRQDYYDIVKIANDDTIDGNIITKDTKNIFKTLNKYLNE